MAAHDQINTIWVSLKDEARWKKYPDAPYEELLATVRDQTRIDLFRAVIDNTTDENRAPVFKALSATIRRVFADRVPVDRFTSPEADMRDVILFNNHPKTTHVDVLRLLELSSMPTVEM